MIYFFYFPNLTNLNDNLKNVLTSACFKIKSQVYSCLILMFSWMSQCHPRFSMPNLKPFSFLHLPFHPYPAKEVFLFWCPNSD